MGEKTSEKVPHILFVDDEFNWCYVMKELGDLLGFSVTVTSNPKEVLKLLASGAFDILITDIRMPTESGYDLIRKVRRKYPKLPIMVLTGFDTDKLHTYSKALNIQKVMIKPFRISDLEAAIRDILGRRGS